MAAWCPYDPVIPRKLAPNTNEMCPRRSVFCRIPGRDGSTGLDGPSSPPNEGVWDKTHVPSGCDANERLRR
ncbi:MAG: hypothetical protein KAX78_06045, partial [Phycisphaerae bacterium]|nr:hypothetical protein [Phycisphaerae bacterium]